MRSLKTWFVTLCLISGNYGIAVAQSPADFKNIQIKPPFHDATIADPFLMHGMVDVKEIGGTNYFLSVGMTTVKRKQAADDDPRRFIMMRKVAAAKAKAEMAKFLNTEISQETLMKKEAEAVSVYDKEQVTKTKRVTRTIVTITRERAKESLPGVKEVGSWLSADGNFYYVLMAACLPN